MPRMLDRLIAVFYLEEANLCGGLLGCLLFS